MADPYAVLTEKLGHPGSERLTGVLKRLMDPEEAEIAASLPCPADELARRPGTGEQTVETKLNGLFSKGVVFMTSKGYRFARDIMQLHDATAADVRRDDVWGRELLDLWEDFCQAEWYRDWANMIQTLNVPAWRIIPARKAVPEGAELLSTEDWEVILDRATRFAVTHCPCRRKAQRCDAPVEVCLQLNRAAEYAMARGTGRELTREEAMEVLDRSAEAGLIHSAANAAEVAGAVCNCCPDCCIFFYPLTRYGGLQQGVAATRFRARVDSAACTGCQTCIERCPFEALDMVKVPGEKKLKAEVEPEKCFGCGVCVVGCESGAIRLVEVVPPEHIPA